MTHLHRLAAASLLLLGLAFSPAGLAHSSVHTYLGFGQGPITLGIDLGHFFHSNRHARQHSHRHSPRCYRQYSRGHSHWGHQSRSRHGWWDTPQRHRHNRGYAHTQRNHGPRRGHQPRHSPTRQHARPSHTNRRGHQHTRDCYLHYERGHSHWK